jgi:hypothetical protein
MGTQLPYYTQGALALKQLRGCFFVKSKSNYTKIKGPISWIAKFHTHTHKYIYIYITLHNAFKN